MKLRHILYAVLLAVLLASCDGSVLVEVVTAEDTPDKNYQKILGVDSSGTVYYQNRKGLFSNSSSSEQGSDIYSKVLNGEHTLVANSNGALVQYSYLYRNQYLLYFQTDRSSNDGYRSTIGLYDLGSGINHPSVPLRVTGVTATSDGYWIKGLHEDGGLVVFDDANDKVYLCHPETVNSSAVTFALTDSDSVLDVANTSSMQYDVGAYYFQRTQAKTYSMMTRVHKVNNDEEDDDDYDADLYFFKWNSGVPSLLAKSSGTHPYRPANFVINSSEKAAYVLCTNGRLYKYSLVSETATEIDYKSSGYSYGTGCMMYYISSGGKEYIVTKPNYKNRAIIVLEFTEDTAGATEIADFDDSSLRKGFAYRLDSDLINCFYELRTDVSSKSNLLSGTNESGMVSITINWDNVTNNSSSNGSTSASEQYDTTL